VVGLHRVGEARNRRHGLGGGCGKKKKTAAKAPTKKNKHNISAISIKTISQKRKFFTTTIKKGRQPQPEKNKTKQNKKKTSIGTDYINTECVHDHPPAHAALK
jgi:hypothetical protein